MPIILDGTTGITTPGITNTGTFVFQGPVQVPAGSAATASITTAAGANTGIFFPSSSSVAITTAGTQRFVVSASGDVGIGTSSPSQKLEVAGAAKLTGTNLAIVPSTTTSAAYLVNTNAGGNFFVGIDNSTGGSFGAGAYGRILYSGGAYPIAFFTNDTERMRLDSSGNLGLGVTPGAWAASRKAVQLGGSVGLFAGPEITQVSANVVFDGASKYIANGFAALYGMDSSEHRWYTAASGTAGNTISFTQAMTLDASGRLGIGTTSPASILDVRFAAGTTGSIVNIANSSSAAAGNIVPIRFFTGNTFGGLEQCAAIWGINPNAGANNGGALVFATSANGTATTPSERARITSTGNVGINTSSPDNAQLVVKGGTAYTANTYFAARLQSANYADSGGYTTMLGFGVESAAWSKAAIGFTRTTSYDVGYLGFYVNSENLSPSMVGLSDERARITSGGDLLVGTTTGSFSRIVKSLSGNYAFQVVNTNATNPYGMEVNMSGVTGGAGQAFFVCYDNANRLVIYGSGNVQNVNNSYGSLSDIKLKQDVVDAASQWNDIKSLRVRKYRFKENPNAALQIGLVAQELEQVSPGLVDESPDRDSEGNYLGTTTKAIKYSVLYMKAIKALQEAMARIEVLEADMAVLKGSN